MINQTQALEFCRVIEKALAPKWHCGLTGGCLYKDGERKDVDIVIYQHDGKTPKDTEVLAALAPLCIQERPNSRNQKDEEYGRCVIPCTYKDATGAGFNVDLFLFS